MKSKRLSLCVASVCLVLVFVSIYVAVEKADCAERARVLALSQTYHWKMTAWFPAGHNENRHLIQFIDTMKQRTDGKVNITIYEGTLGAPGDHWDMLKGNAIQLTLEPRQHVTKVVDPVAARIRHLALEYRSVHAGIA